MDSSGLLLIDIQNDYFPGGLMELEGSESAAHNAATLLYHFRHRQNKIVHIRHIATRPESLFFLPGSYGSEISGFVTPQDDEEIIIKHYPNSFRDTPLLEFLQSFGIQKLYICGMMTHMCIDATCRAATDYGFKCVLISDACTTRDCVFEDTVIPAKYVHAAFLSSLHGFYATVVRTSDLIDEWKKDSIS